MPYKTREESRNALRRWRAANPDKTRAIWKRQQADPAYKEKAKKRSHDWWAANRERHKLNVRRNHYTRTHGITIEAFDAMFASQNSRCGLCGTDKPGPRGWQLDHNHKYKPGDPLYARGILCSNCNRGGGCFRDNPELLRKAADWFSR
jgi:Recombination endonuclease VII